MAKLYNNYSSAFDEDNPRDHLIKLLMGNGMFIGTRGAESAKLEVRHILHGVFAEPHPYTGYEYWGWDGFNDKTHSISMMNTTFRDASNDLHMPLLSNEKNNGCYAGVLKR